MNKVTVPAAPLPSHVQTGPENQKPVNQAQTAARDESASKTLAPLDAAFLSRSYWTFLWFGVAMSACVAMWSKSGALTLSFIEGMMIGVLLMKSQEMFVRRAVRRKDAPPYSGWDAFIPLPILLPLKYLLIGGLMVLLLHVQKVNLILFGLGFMAVQFALLARLTGRLAQARVKSVNEVYVQSGKSNAR